MHRQIHNVQFIIYEFDRTLLEFLSHYLENFLEWPKIGLVYHTLPWETLCENVRKQGIMDHFIILLLLTDIFNPYWHEL